MGEQIIGGVSDFGEGQPAGGEHLDLGHSIQLVADTHEVVNAESPLTDRDAPAHQGAHHAVAERVSPNRGNQHAGCLAHPPEIEQCADRRGLFPRLAVRSEVVESPQGAGCGIHRGDIELTAHHGGAVTFQRIVGNRIVSNAILIATPYRREPRIEAVRCDRGAGHRGIGVGAEHTPDATGESCYAVVILRAPARRSEPCGLSVVEIQVSNLAARVHSGVSSTRHDQPRISPQHARNRTLDRSLHRPLMRLPRPPAKVRTVVGNVEPDAHVFSLISTRRSPRELAPPGRRLGYPNPHRPTEPPLSSPLHTDRHGAIHGATSGPRLPGLDGLRALAVILVVVFHLFPQWWFVGGFIGVDVFFVISGFLITTLLLRERDATGRISLVGFWRRRARRLLPALVLLLLVCSSAAWVVGGDVLVRLGAQIAGALTFSYNWIAIFIGEGYFGATSPELFRNLWSLGIEEQFYVLWPLALPLILLLPRTWARVAAAGALAAASAVWMGDIVSATGNVSRAYYGTDSHAFGILLGVALAFVLHRALAAPTLWMQRTTVRRGATILGAAAVIGLVGLSLLAPTDSVRTFPLTIAAASALTGIAIVAAVWPHAGLGPALDARPLRWIGERSYGLYLWHWPLLVLLVAAVQGTAPEAGVPVWVGLVTLALTVVIAEASYRFLETPVRRLGFRGTWRAARARVGVDAGALWGTVVGSLATTALVFGTVAAATTGASVSSGEAVVAEGQAAVDAASASPTPSADDQPQPDEPAPAGALADGAVRPPAPSPTPISGGEVTAVGDSVMLAAAPSLYETLPGIRVDAAVSRSSWAGPGIVDQFAAAGQLGRYVVVALGTNGPISRDAYERIAATAGPDRTLVLVNAYAPRDWIPGVNSDITAFAAAHPGTVIADWASAIDPHVDYLAGDRIHPGTSGGQIYADTVLAAIRQSENQRAIDAYLIETRAYREATREEARIAQ